MKLIVSFLLSVIIYSIIVVFFLFFLFPKPKPEKKVYIHTAILVNKSKINFISHKQKKQIIAKPPVSKIKKAPKKIKKRGSKTDITHGGKNIGFNDIFKNVKYNVETKKFTPKAQLQLSRLKGVEADLKKIKKISIQINFVQNSGKALSKKEIDNIISQKLYVIWYDISTIPSDYAKINIQSNNGNVVVNILSSNLSQNKQQQLVSAIKKVNFDKNFNITVLFQSKVNND